MHRLIMSRISFDVSKQEHQEIKILASLSNTTIKNLFMESLKNFKKTNLNKSTIKAIKELEAGTSVEKFKSSKDLYKNLEI